MSEDIKPEAGAIPPRLNIKVPGQTGDVESGLHAAPATDSSLPGNKKKTSRISLDQVTAEPGAAPAASVSGIGMASKTIRLAPAMTGQVSINPLPSVGKALSGVVIPDDGKRQTSRIPLDTVMSGKTDPGSSGGDATPKTIKVKRPILSVSPKMTPMQEELPQPSASNEKSKTARVDIVPEALAEPQQTQKKTIKIRRADGGGEAKPMMRSAGGAQSGGAPAAVPGGMPESSGVPAPHWMFLVTATAALLVLGYMVYVQSAQAFPNLGWNTGL